MFVVPDLATMLTNECLKRGHSTYEISFLLKTLQAAEWHFLRDKEKHQVDFLPVVDNRPLSIIEVKVSDENFSPSLFRFHKKLESAKPYQIVYQLKRKNSKEGVRMLPAHEFLKDLRLSEESEHRPDGRRGILER